MSFMEHLVELRRRILAALAGVGVAFLASLIFANDLWRVVSEPAVEALTSLGYESAKLAQIKPMETFTIVWVKLPILTAIFLSSPWILYQVWAFIAPGLYKKERRWAAPFVICSAGLFILGGLFAYFVAFRFGLTFLLGIGRNINILPMVSISEYFDLFVNVTLGIGLVFELPILIFFLTLLRIVTPGFLVRNARYAVLIIVVIAAIITPTPDVVNLMLFSIPMCLLYFVGIFSGYLLNLHRDRRQFPWSVLLIIVLAFVALAVAGAYFAITKYGYQFEASWPFLAR
jgi:sec-independent protein translocase protein TatC